MAGHVTRVREMRNTLKIYVRNPQWKRSLWRSMCKLDDNIKVDLKVKGCVVVDWIELAQYRVQWQVSEKMMINSWFHKSWGFLN